MPAPSATSSGTQTKSGKRGIAYDLSSTSDLGGLATGTSWWYNYTSLPNSGISQSVAASEAMEYVPMLWNDNFDASAVEQYLAAHPSTKNILVLNEPNVAGQAYMTPQQAATLWPRYEAVAATSNVNLIGPQITYGTMPGYEDPVAWLDAFYAAYRATNGRDPRVDALGFHWYDYGIAAQLDRLEKYGKPFWVTEFANWHTSNDSAQIDTLAKQEAQMTDMVSTLETRSDVLRYAWFTGRISPDPHYDSILGATGQRTALGDEYLSLPF